MLAKRVLVGFILIPLIEMYLLIKIGQALGVWLTLALVVGLGALGFVLVRTQGLYVLYKVRSEVSSGKLPGDTVLDGVLVLLGGILLITPGVLTASIGFVIMFPAARRPLRRIMRVWLANQLRLGRWHFQFRGY